MLFNWHIQSKIQRRVYLVGNLCRNGCILNYIVGVDRDSGHSSLNITDTRDEVEFHSLSASSFFSTLVQIRIWDFEAKKAEHLIA